MKNYDSLGAGDHARVPCASFNDHRAFLSVKSNMAQTSKETDTDNEVGHETSPKYLSEGL